MRTPIADYAPIGDSRSVALVSRSGSIDWLCWPRFDSPSVFGALLGEGAGCWRIGPLNPLHSLRRYVPETNVLETEFRTESGRAILTDLMPVASEEEKQAQPLPEHEILRIAACVEGEVEIVVHFEPRPGYGRRAAEIRPTPALGWKIRLGPGLLTLRTEAPLERVCGTSLRGQVRLRAGQAVTFSLTYAHHWPAVFAPLGPETRRSVDRSVRWWKTWSSRMAYDGPHRDAVLRSALALRLLVYAPSGAIVAAPTTSLPERLGGDLNWDYRYCWLRDAALTVRALLGLGYEEEAHAFLSWLLHTTRLTRPKLRALYDLFGRNPPGERELGHLPGYGDSRPVRVGNRAEEQLQLDVYGEVLDALASYLQRGGTLDRETRRLIRGFGLHVCRNWNEPDEGIWEPRSGRVHHTHSRLLCWTALDRLIELHSKGHLPDAPVEEFRSNREAIRRDIEARAWNEALGSYVSVLDGDSLDASLLLIPWYGFEPASTPRMQRTARKIREALGTRDGLLYRYPAAGGSTEGAFGIASFWGAECLALGAGTLEEAEELFGSLLGRANDLGLYAEEIDPPSGEALGNYPQGFTHVGLINAALSIDRRRRGRTPIPHKVGSPTSGSPADAEKHL